jgi:hypothetical protein
VQQEKTAALAAQQQQMREAAQVHESVAAALHDDVHVYKVRDAQSTHRLTQSS